MDAWERFRNTVERKEVDYPATALIGTSRFYASIAGFELADVLHRPEAMLASQSRVFELFPEVTFIPGVWPDYGVAILSAYGCRVFWLEGGMPQVKGEIIRGMDDIKSLEIPNPKTDGWMPHYLRTLAMFLKTGGIFTENARFVWSFGPGEMAAYFCGTSLLFMSLINDPALSHAVLEKATQGIITWIHAQLDINPRALGMLLTDDIAGMVSREHYEEFILPCHERIRKAFPDLMIVFHNDTKSDHILSSIVKTGFEVFNFGKTTNITTCRDAVSEKICLMGNIDPLDLMIHGSAEQVYEKAREVLAVFHGRKGYILSVGGGLNQGIPPENIHALTRAARESAA